jgi:hypothetical protein
MAPTGNDTWNVASTVEPTTPEAPAAPQPAHRVPSRRRKWTMVGGLKKVWLPLVIVFAVAVAAFCVDRLHGLFGRTETTRPGSGLANDTKPFNPKTVKYEIYGLSGATATINYLDLDAQPQEVINATLPWELTLTTTAPAASANIVAQGDGNSISCRITVNGEVKDTKTTDGLNAQTFCLVKSA